MVEAPHLRLKRVLDHLKAQSALSTPEFYVALKSSTAQISKLKRGVQKINQDFVENLLAYEPSVNLNWIFTGRGEMFLSSITDKVEDPYIKKSDLTEMLKATIKEMELIEKSKGLLLDDDELE